MCFPFAAKKAEEWFDSHFEARKGRAPKRHPDLNNMDKFRVIHGKVTNKWKSPPKPVVHAWVEMGDLVFDDQTRITQPGGIPKDVYYDMYQPEVVKEYNAEEVVVNCTMKGEGPWDTDLLDVMQHRDAWMKESRVRDYVRRFLAEDPARRQALAKDLEGAENWPTKTASRHRRYQFDSSKALPSGRVLKKAFHKHADQAFMKSLTTVHWADNPDMIATLLKGSSKDEISTSAYLPGELQDTYSGAYGAYGLEIKGHISLLANNMDVINTGGQSDPDYPSDDSHRTKSSGKNKGVKKTYIPSAYASDKDALVVLDKSDWNPQGSDVGIYNNEALVDNWSPVAIIITNEEYYEDGDVDKLEAYADNFGLEIKRTKGELG